jgi:hypothetical protein
VSKNTIKISIFIFGEKLVRILVGTSAISISWFYSHLPGKRGDGTSVRPRPFPYISFPIHYSLTILPLDTRTLYNKSQKNRVLRRILARAKTREENRIMRSFMKRTLHQILSVIVNGSTVCCRLDGLNDASPLFLSSP